MHFCSCNISLASNNGTLNEGFNLISYNEASSESFYLIHNTKEIIFLTLVNTNTKYKNKMWIK